MTDEMTKDPKEQITTDPSKASERMRAGSLSLTVMPWVIAAIALLIMPLSLIHISEPTRPY